MTTTSRLVLLFSFVPLAAGAAQTGPARAAATITQADIVRRINIIAHDSMGGRDTPSPGLESTARYLAREFERMGLEPAGTDGYYQRYPIRVRRLDPAGSTITLGGSGALSFPRDARLVSGSPVGQAGNGEMVIGGGPLQPTTELDLSLASGRTVLWAAEPRLGASLGQVAAAAGNAGATLLVVSLPDDSAFGRLPTGTAPAVVAEGLGRPPVIVIRESALGAGSALAAALAEARTAPEARLRSGSWRVSLQLAFSEDRRVEVPNVVGLVRGTDPELRAEFVAISAHFDHVGSRCRGVTAADSICNGADDNGSGTTGLLELAEAFANPAARPRRSMLFVAVSGEERGLWGSEYFARHPTVPLDRVVAAINMDHLGRNWTDSIVVIGQEHSDLGGTVNRVAAEHRDLGVGVLPDQWPEERIYFRSDHYNFAREGVPILFFTNGFHPDYHAVTDSPDKINAEKMARVVRLIFQTGLAISNQTARPRWNPDSERQIVRRRSAVP